MRRRTAGIERDFQVFSLLFADDPLGFQCLHLCAKTTDVANRIDNGYVQ